MPTEIVINRMKPIEESTRSIKKNFSISELEQFSGIKAHTIRVWEQRYNLFKPERTRSNIRFYTVCHIKRLLDIALLLKNGHRISKIVALEPLALEEKMNDLNEEAQNQDKTLNTLILCMLLSDIEKFQDELDECVHIFGIHETIGKVILPFLEKVELLSYKDKNYETHFAVTSIRGKIILGIEKEKNKSGNQPSALLFLPQGEHYDLMLLYMAYMLKRQGLRVLYLGTDISVENLKRIKEEKMPDFLYTYIPQKSKLKVCDYSIYLSKQLPGITLKTVTCEPAIKPTGIKNVEIIHYRSL